MTKDEIRTLNYLLPEDGKLKADVIALIATYENGEINEEELSKRLQATIKNRRKSDMLIETLEG